MARIIIDHRERNSGIIEDLAKKELNIEQKQLISADFVIYGKDKDGKNIRIGIEKKTQNDFLNSIIDKRIINQIISLKKNFDVPLLIIEGSENLYEIRDFHPNSIRGMLASIIIDYQVPIIYTKNYRDTASFLETIAKRLEKTRKPVSLLKRRKPLGMKGQQELIIETLPGIGPKIAKSLLKKFKTVKEIINATEKDLRKVKKIGVKKAGKIREIIETKYN